VDQERALTEGERDEFEEILRALNLEINQIKEAMGFSLDNIHTTSKVFEVLTESLTLKGIPIPNKFERLMLVLQGLVSTQIYSIPLRYGSALETKSQ